MQRRKKDLQFLPHLRPKRLVHRLPSVGRVSFVLPFQKTRCTGWMDMKSADVQAVPVRGEYAQGPIRVCGEGRVALRVSTGNHIVIASQWASIYDKPKT